MGIIAGLGMWEAINEKDLPNWVKAKYKQRCAKKWPATGEVWTFRGKTMLYRMWNAPKESQGQTKEEWSIKKRKKAFTQK